MRDYNTDKKRKEQDEVYRLRQEQLTWEVNTIQDSLGCDINKAYNFKNVSLIGDKGYITKEEFKRTLIFINDVWFIFSFYNIYRFKIILL